MCQMTSLLDDTTNRSVSKFVYDRCELSDFVLRQCFNVIMSCMIKYLNTKTPPKV